MKVTRVYDKSYYIITVDGVHYFNRNFTPTMVVEELFSGGFDLFRNGLCGDRSWISNYSVRIWELKVVVSFNKKESTVYEHP